MNRNRVDYFSHVGTPHMPRYTRTFTPRRLQTVKHGTLTPFYSRLVYPHSNLKVYSSDFIRMDTSLKVPLDDIIFDKFYFFVPLRIIDPNFEKIMGLKNTYDETVYNFPTMQLDGSSTYPLTHDSLINYFGYATSTKLDDPNGYLTPIVTTADSSVKTGGYKTTVGDTLDKVNVYQLGAYYKIYNEYFRDEHLDPEVPIQDLLTNINPTRTYLLANSATYIWQNFDCLPVNRLHDIFSSGVVSPTGLQGDVKIPMGSSLIPVGIVPTTSGSGSGGSIQLPSGSYTAGTFLQALSTSPVSKPLVADMSAATGASIQQLYLSMALYSLYDKRGTFGSRLIEQIRGSFGLEVPDGLLDRAEYLGGGTQNLSNNPVLNMSDDLGEMRGNSATLTNITSFDKGFNEWGFVIGVYCLRVKHSFGQGIANPAWHIFDNLDFYWPEFANIGKLGIQRKRLVNNPNYPNTNNDNFNYNEAYIDQETEIDFCAGDFGSWRHANVQELQTQWTYQDIYGSSPFFSMAWLKEPSENVRRTLAGVLIPNSSDVNHANDDNDLIIGGHQYMIETRSKVELTLAKPPRSHAPNITGRI